MASGLRELSSVNAFSTHTAAFVAKHSTLEVQLDLFHHLSNTLSK